MRTSLIRVTERGESVVTTQLLLDTVLDAIYQAVSVDEFDTSCCSYLVGAMNQMARCGLLEPSKTSPEGRAGQKPSFPDEPPPFFKHWTGFAPETPDAPEV